MAVRWSAEFFTAMEYRDLQANAMAVDKTGTYVLLAGRRYIAIKNLSDPDTDSIRKFPRQSKYEVGTAEWSPTDHHKDLCVISSNQRLEVLTWQSSELTQTHSLRAHTRVITDLNWHRSDPNLVASCSVDTFIHIWDIRDPRRPALSLSAVAEASQVRWNRISSHLLATAHDGDLKLWDQRKGTAPVQYIAAHLSKINGLDWSPHSETQLVTSSQDSTIKFFDTNNPRRAEFVLTTSAPVWRARYTPFGVGLVTVVVPQLRRGENSLSLWNTTSRASPVHTFVGHRDVVLEFEWRKQNVGDTDFQLVTWSRDQTLLVWRVEPFLQKLCGHDPDSQSVDVPEGIALDETAVLEKSTESLSVVQPLQQEFSLLNVSIPNLEVVKMDPVRRFCTVTANVNSNIAVLQITFPNLYPNGVPPIFQVAQGSTVEDGIASQILNTVAHTAQQRVLKNRTCLEPCLRQFVSSLEQLSDPSETHKLHQRAYLEPDVLGSFNDACIPFPRTSGAKFCSVSILVCFARQSPVRRASVKVETSTPRALSALGNTFSNRRASDYMTVSSYYLQKQRSRSKHKTPQKAVITVYDVAGLFFVSRQLAEQYVVDEDVTRVCKQNSDAASALGRWDLIQAWSLAELVVGETEEDATWSKHPFGQYLMKSLIKHYALHSDFQMAAMLSCILGKAQEERYKKKLLPKQNIMSTGSPYHTIPPADVVADGWVFPLLRTPRFNSLENVRVEEHVQEIVPQLRPAISAFSEYYKLVYAEMLHRWGLLYNRAEILKLLSTPTELHKGVEFLTDCQHCIEPTRSNSCPSCKKLSLNCVVCHISVRGSANACLVCGHGGHTGHMQQWFARNTLCPSGCGCACLLETAGLFS